MRTSDHDTKVAEVLGLSLVFVALLVFLRNLWLAIVAEVCLGVGIVWTFGWATVSVGRLNLLSLVFVIALIGIGMDYLIQVLSHANCADPQSIAQLGRSHLALPPQQRHDLLACLALLTMV